MKLRNIEKAVKLLPEFEDKAMKLSRARLLVSLTVADGFDRVLRDYDPPSNIGAAFATIKAALIELHEKEFNGVKRAMEALGVEFEP
jgi:hypothetical protein